MLTTPAKPLRGGQSPGCYNVCGSMCVLVGIIQKCVTLSTTEAEYIALADTMKGAMFLRYIWRFIFPWLGTACITAFEDNGGAKNLAQNPVCTSNSEHIDVRHRWVRELGLKGEFRYHSCRVGSSACRRLDKAARLHGFLLLIIGIF